MPEIDPNDNHNPDKSVSPKVYLFWNYRDLEQINFDLENSTQFKY